MSLHSNLLGINLFLHSYTQADWLGKSIFLALLLLSILTWTLILYKGQKNKRARSHSLAFHHLFEEQRHHPLGLRLKPEQQASPFGRLYQVMKQFSVDLLDKNQRFSPSQQSGTYLSPSDIELIEAQLRSAVATETQQLSHNLYILATIVTLAPFLGLLGTVWGILTTFSDPSMITGGAGSEAVLGGMSLALVTTVLGLIDAIPALIGYNYLRNAVAGFETEMDVFTDTILGSVEMQYRQVDLRDHREPSTDETT